ncbi:MAG: hypothetical protein ACYDDV_06895 [Methanoregula sp.]
MNELTALNGTETNQEPQENTLNNVRQIATRRNVSGIGAMTGEWEG